MRFYKVTNIEGSNSSQYMNDSVIYWLSPETQIILSQTNEDSDNTNHTTSLINHNQRLPQPSIVKDFLYSLKKRSCLDCSERDESRSKLHSFSTEVARIILAVSTDSWYNSYGTKILLSRQMLHVICDDGKELNMCLDGAADRGEFYFQSRR